jgi:hypothetical protein
LTTWNGSRNERHYSVNGHLSAGLQIRPNEERSAMHKALVIDFVVNIARKDDLRG